MLYSVHSFMFSNELLRITNSTEEAEKANDRKSRIHYTPRTIIHSRLTTRIIHYTRVTLIIIFYRRRTNDQAPVQCKCD